MTNGNRSTRNAIGVRVWWVVFSCLAMAVLLCLTPSLDGQDRGAMANAPANAGDVTRGKYLVEHVAMCGQCHTPRDMKGVLDRSRWLQGASVPWVPAQGQLNWPLMAPRIGGTPPASDGDLVRLLTTGVWTNGEQLRFPMMPFRMSEADARAVIAYLKTPSAWK